MRRCSASSRVEVPEARNSSRNRLSRLLSPANGRAPARIACSSGRRARARRPVCPGRSRSLRRAESARPWDAREPTVAHREPEHPPVEVAARGSRRRSVGRGRSKHRHQRDHERVRTELARGRPETARASPSARAPAAPARALAPSRSARRRVSAAGGGSAERCTTPACSSSRKRCESTSGPRSASPSRRSVKRFGPSSNSRATSSAQRSPITSSPRAIPHGSPYVRLVRHQSIP